MKRYFLMGSIPLVFFLSSAYCQVPDRDQESVKSLFTKMLQLQSKAEMPSNERVLRTVRTLPDDKAAVVRDTLPSILAALSHNDDEVRFNASLALFAISTRSDSSELLQQHLEKIGLLFSEPNARLQTAGAHILGNLKPLLPQQAISLLTEFITQTGKNAGAQVAAMHFLLRRDPHNPQIVNAVQRFFGLPLTASERGDAIGALSSSRITNVELRRIVMNSLNDPADQVKVAAIRAVSRIGSDALLEAKPKLQKLAIEPSFSPEVRVAAEKALRKLAQPVKQRH